MRYLIEKFWAHQVARGDKPLPVWAIVSLGDIQPKGCIIGWSVNKAQAEKKMKSYEGSWRLEKIEKSHGLG